MSSFTLIGGGYPDLSQIATQGALPTSLKGENHNLAIQHTLPAGAGTYVLATADTGADSAGTYNLLVTCTMDDGTNSHFLNFGAYVTPTSMTYFGPGVSAAVFGITQVGNKVSVTMARNGATAQSYNIRMEIRPVTLDPLLFKVDHVADAAKKTQQFF